MFNGGRSGLIAGHHVLDMFNGRRSGLIAGHHVPDMFNGGISQGDIPLLPNPRRAIKTQTSQKEPHKICNKYEEHYTLCLPTVKN